jgi:sugar transferase (PEP-CTERM system associated)
MLPSFAVQVVVMIVVFQTTFYVNDLYRLNGVRHRSEELVRLGQSLGFALLLLGLLYFLFPSLLIRRGVFFIGMSLIVFFEFSLRILLDKIWRVAATEHIAILGTQGLSIAVARELGKRDDLNVHLAGFVDMQPGNASADSRLFHYPIIGSVDDLESIVQTHQISRIVVALQERRGALPTAALVRLRVQGIVIEEAQCAVSALTGRVWLEAVRPSWFVFSEGFHRSRATLVFKRLLDIAFSVIGLVLSAPICLLVAVLIKLDSKGPILYRQERVGWKGRTFHVLKFRSMRVDAEAHSGAQWAHKNDSRVTRIGKYLRKFRIDELPQFLNVIRGEMSFVGPRPERPVFVEQLRTEIPYYDERHSVRPGLTGWAQVNYPYGASVADAYRKLEYDLFYLKHMSTLFDCAIVFRTIRTVISGTYGR